MDGKALLVIDMLNDFMDPGGALFCGENARKIIPTVGALVLGFHARGDAVIYVRDAHAPDDKEFELFAPHAVKGTWGSQVIPELTPPAGSILVDKTRFSALYGSDLSEVLVGTKAEEIWLCGVCTSICVMDTAGDLRNRDYRVVIAQDAVADFDSEFHEFALKRMVRIYGARLEKSPA